MNISFIIRLTCENLAFEERIESKDLFYPDIDNFKPEVFYREIPKTHITYIPGSVKNHYIDHYLPCLFKSRASPLKIFPTNQIYVSVYHRSEAT